MNTRQVKLLGKFVLSTADLISIIGGLVNIAAAGVALIPALRDPWRSGYWLTRTCVLGLVGTSALGLVGYLMVYRFRKRKIYLRRPTLPKWLIMPAVVVVVVPLVVYPGWIKTQFNSLVRHREAVALLTLVDDAVVRSTVPELQAALDQQNIDLYFEAIQSDPSSAGGDLAIETFRRNSGFSAAVWADARWTGMPESQTMALSVQRTPPLGIESYTPSSTYELDPADSPAGSDLAAHAGLSVVEYISLRWCEQREYGAVLELARDWGQLHEAQWSGLLKKHPHYLWCWLEASYEEPAVDALPVWLPEEEWISALDEMLSEGQLFPGSKSLLYLAKAQLLFRVGHYDDIEKEVLTPDRIRSFEEARQVDAYRLLAEVALAKAQALSVIADKNARLLEAIEWLARCREMDQSAAQTCFKLGEAHVLLALIAADSTTSGEHLMQAIDSFQCAQDHGPSQCLERKILTWLSAAYAMAGDRDASRAARDRLVEIPCSGAGSIDSMDTPLIFSGTRLPVRMSLPADVPGAWVSVARGAYVPLHPIQRGAVVYTATVDLVEALVPPYDFVYYDSQAQLEVQKPLQLSVLLGKQPSDAGMADEIFPLVVVSEPRLVTRVQPDGPVILTPGASITVSASIVGSFPGLEPVQTLGAPDLLERLRFMVRFENPDLDAIPMRPVGSAGWHTASFGVADKVDAGGYLAFNVVALSLAEHDAAEPASVLQSVVHPVHAVSPTPPTPTPTPTPTGSYLVAVLDQDPPVAYEAPAATAVTFTLPVRCPLVVVLPPSQNHSLDWYERLLQDEDPDWLEILYQEEELDQPLWVPEASLGGYAQFDFEGMRWLAVVLADTTVYTSASSHVPSSLTLHACDLLRLDECREGSCKFDGYRVGGTTPYHGWVSEQDVSGPVATIEMRAVPWP